MRLIALFLSLILVAQTADAARGKPQNYSNSRGNPRYAALVMNADSGEILYESHAREQRYPASLTKMMTLYMVFDALKTGKIKMSTEMTASKKAAAQPRTNIALRPGDKITVQTAIKALTVHSANDVSLVFAEELGGSEWNFGVMMTNKARQIGMRNSVFRNANGLPDSRQHTTAYDMAVLGRALRKDFPEHYANFSIKSFQYKNRSYYGHNRVLGRLPGVDGIKTGFINASGFNLVSSLKNEGVSLIAVVMGGISGPSRDNEMVGLLKKHYDTQLALLKKNPAAYAAKKAVPEAALANASPAATIAPAAPKPIIVAKVNPQAVAKIIVKTPEAEQAIAGTMFNVPPAAKAAEAARIAAIVPRMPSPSGKPAATAPRPSVMQVSFNSDAQKRANTLDYQFAMLSTTATDAPSLPSDGKGWGVQVGAFRSPKQAKDAAKAAIGSVSELKSAYLNITTEGDPSASIHRARLGNLSKSEAEVACRKLNAINSACFPLRIN